MRMRHYLFITVALLLAFARPAASQPPFAGGGGGPLGLASQPIEKTGDFLLLLNPSVQDELKLDKDQRDRLAKLPETVRARHKQAHDQLQKDIKEDQEKTAKATEEFYKKADAELGRILKPEQARRLKQIQLQLQGLSAFFDTNIVEALKLTEKQQRELRKLREALSRDASEIRTKSMKDGPVKAPPPFMEMAAMDSKATAKAVELLNDQQKSTWKELTGEPSPLAAGNMGSGLAGQPISDARRRFSDFSVLSNPEVWTRN